MKNYLQLLIFIISLLLVSTNSYALEIDSCQTLSSSITYTLNQSINSSGTCFTIGASDMIIDGNGFTINYSQSVTGYAFNSTAGSYDNVTIKNFNIVQENISVNDSYAIYVSGMVNGTIVNNTITTEGYYADGISLESSSISNNVSNNTITGLNEVAGIYISSSCDSNIVDSNIINVTSHGIVYVTSNSTNFTNNEITTNNGYGIYYITSFETSIENNTITLTDTTKDGIYFVSSDLNIIENNTISTTGVTSSGVWLNSNSDSNNVTDNTITTTGSTSHGIYVKSSSILNRISDNSITVNGSLSQGIYIYDYSDSNTIHNNIITVSGYQSRCIYIYFFSDSNIITENTLNISNEYPCIKTTGISEQTIIRNNTINLVLEANIDGIDINSEYTTVENNVINTFTAYGDGIYVNDGYNNISGNRIITNGQSTGVNLVVSNNNISNNNITLNSLLGKGIKINSDSNDIVNNRITSTGDTVYDIIIGNSANSNTILDNTVVKSGSGCVVYFDFVGSSNNNFTGGSIASSGSGTDYCLNSVAGSTQTFTNTDFTTRTLSLGSTDWFNYNNETTSNIWLKTKGSASITRTLVSWLNSLFSWNDTSTTTTITYNLTGLLTNTEYHIYNSTGGTQSNPHNLITDSSGDLNFTLYVDGNTLISIELGKPTITLVEPQNTTHNNYLEVPLQVSIDETIDWCGYSLDGATNVTFIPNTTISVDPSASSHYIQVFCNDTVGFMNETEIRYFSLNLDLELTKSDGSTTDSFVVKSNDVTTHSYIIDNTGATDLTFCNLSFSNRSAGTSLSTYSTFNISNFNLSVGENTTFTMVLNSVPASGSIYYQHIIATCAEVVSSINVDVSSSTPTAPGGGGGGAEPTITCNYDYNCDYGESISTCPNDCTFPLILKPAGANITAYFGYSVVKSMTVYNNVSWDIENVELWFEGTENDTRTYELALFEIGTIRNTTIKSTIETKGPITTGFYYFNLVSELPENVTSGQYYVVIKAQNIEERYLVNVKTQDIEVPRNFFIILVIAGVILIAIKLISG